MAIEDDFSIDFETGAIRATTPGQTWRYIDLHRYIGALADDAQAAGGGNDDILDISSLTPSERITDEIIELIDYTSVGGPRYNIDDATNEWLYGGSLLQGSGDTEEQFSGLQILGSVIDTATQVQIVQDGDLVDGDAPFWGNQVTPFNGDEAAGILMRVSIKTRVNGADIDGKRVIVQIRNYGDTYAYFLVTLGTGEKTAATSSVADPQNKTPQGTVTAYTHVSNIEGFQLLDIGDGNGDQPYYSKWTYGVDTAGDQLKSVWEWVKDLTRTGTAKTNYGIDGELFRGITHSYLYDALVGGPFVENETVVWGTQITYNTLVGGTFAVGDYVRIGASGAAGRIMYDNGSTQMTVALEDPTITLITADVITAYNKSTGATGVTAAINVTIVDNDKAGGSGLLLANDTTGVEHHVQLRTGLAPVDNLPVRGITSGATAVVNVTVVTQTVAPVFLGSYVGSLIGAFGVGIDPDDLAFPDTVEDLDGDTNSAPNNVTWSLNGVEVAEDRCLVGQKAVGNDFDWDQMTINGALSGAAITTVVVVAIPDNSPQVGSLRITATDGRRLRVPYTAHDGLTDFTIPSFDFSGVNVVADTNGALVAVIDKLATVDPETYTTIYDSAQVLWVRVRDGGLTPIKTYEAQSALGSAGGSATASRISDA